MSVVASILPGVVIHGSGSWSAGDDDTAQRLLLLEGAGLALTAGSLAGLVLTGAARDWVGLLATTSVLGVGAFTVSFLADVYRTATPHGFGAHQGKVPWGTTESGVVWVTNPQFALGPLVTVGAGLRREQWLTRVKLCYAPWALHSRMHVDNGFQFWGAQPETPSPTAGGSHVTLLFGVDVSRWGLEGFQTLGREVRVQTRIDSEHLAPNLRGAFVEWEVGYAALRTTFSETRVYNSESLLITGLSFGAYHGDPATNGGETRLYYDHRHDGYAGGLLASGLGSGVAGHVGLETQHYFSPTWGVRLNSEIGAAWTLGVQLLARVWSQPPPSNPKQP